MYTMCGLGLELGLHGGGLGREGRREGDRTGKDREEAVIVSDV